MDIKKTIQFLLEQQARFDAHQAELSARQAEIVERQAEMVERQAEIVERQAEFVDRQAEFVEREAQFQEKFEDRVVQINDILVRVTSSQERTGAILSTLTERHVELAKSHQELVGAQKVTEQNLSALISTVERHIASHR